MALTQASIREEESDEKLLDLLLGELSQRMAHVAEADTPTFTAALKELPRGLRAMAATYQLDVSMALDDLGWHFGNWHDHGYCMETSRGLHELETGELADLFDRAYAVATVHWAGIGAQADESFSEWYHGSELETATMDLSRRWWELCDGSGGLFKFWTAYARKYPERIVPDEG